MAGGLKKRLSQVAVELEGTEGTAETLAAADATFYCYEPAKTLAPQMFQRDPARAYLGPLASIVGKQVGTISWRTEAKGTGSFASRPAWNDSLIACGFTGATVTAISGSGGGSTFIPGESVTCPAAVGVTGAAGRIVGEWAASGLLLKYVATSATAFTTGLTLTGAVSGASLVTNAAPIASQGYEYRPDDGAKSATVGLYMDGKRTILKGCRGNVALEANVGEPAFFNFTMSGVVSDVTDAALLSPTYDTTVPPAFLSAGLTIKSNAAKFTSVSLDMANTLAEREDANEAKGVLSYLITDRAPTVTINPEDTLEADFRFLGDLLDANTGRAFWKVGSTATNRVQVGLRKIQYEDVGESDRAGLAVADLTVSALTYDESTGDDEVQIGVC